MLYKIYITNKDTSFNINLLTFIKKNVMTIAKANNRITFVLISEKDKSKYAKMFSSIPAMTFGQETLEGVSAIQNHLNKIVGQEAAKQAIAQANNKQKQNTTAKKSDIMDFDSMLQNEIDTVGDKDAEDQDAIQERERQSTKERFMSQKETIQQQAFGRHPQNPSRYKGNAMNMSTTSLPRPGDTSFNASSGVQGANLDKGPAISELIDNVTDDDKRLMSLFEQQGISL